MDELLTNGEFAAGQRDWSPDYAWVYTEYRRLAEEQAALRRLATLVARGAEPSEVFDAVVNEMRRCLVTEGAGLWRYEASDEITLLAAAHHPAAQVMKRPVGFRMTIDSSIATAAGSLASHAYRRTPWVLSRFCSTGLSGFLAAMPTRIPLPANSLAQLELMPGPPPTMSATSCLEG